MPSRATATVRPSTSIHSTRCRLATSVTSPSVGRLRRFGGAQVGDSADGRGDDSEAGRTTVVEATSSRSVRSDRARRHVHLTGLAAVFSRAVHHRGAPTGLSRVRHRRRGPSKDRRRLIENPRAVRSRPDSYLRSSMRQMHSEAVVRMWFYLAPLHPHLDKAASAVI